MVLPGVQQVQFFIYELSLPKLFTEPAIPFMCTFIVDVVRGVNSLAPSAPSTVCCGMEKPEVGGDETECKHLNTFTLLLSLNISSSQTRSDSFRYSCWNCTNVFA